MLALSTARADWVLPSPALPSTNLAISWSGIVPGYSAEMLIKPQNSGSWSALTGTGTTPGAYVTVTGNTGALTPGNYDLIIQDDNANTISSTILVVSPPVIFTLDRTSFTYSGVAQGPAIVPTPSGVPFNAGGSLVATDVGSYTATAVATGGYTGSNNSLTWTIAKASQSISFPNPGTKTFGAPAWLSATATSGLPVTYSLVSGSATLNGNRVDAIVPGSVTIRASQAGNSNYNAASDNTVTFAFTQPDNSNNIVAAASGDFSVDNKGSGNYSVPIAIPPGRSGMQPSLSLSYSSQGGNGPVGVGFSVSTGFPQSITRGRSILARDGITRGVTFTSDDKLYLDGKRLVHVSGAAYGLPGSVYRTEVDSFVTITASGTGSNIETFTMVDKSGTQLTFGKFGTAMDGYQRGGEETAGLAYAYALKRVTDTIGNYIDFNYTDVGNGEYVLANLKYTGNSAQSINPAIQVDFSYNTGSVDGSSARRDASTSYIAMRRFGQTRRLDRITASIPGSSITTAVYDLGYEYAPNQGRTRLVSIACRLRDPSTGTMSQVPTTNFEWSDSSISFTTAREYTTTTMDGFFSPGSPEPFAYGDVNGDGRDEMVSGLLVAFPTSSGFTLSQSWMSTNINLWQVFKLGDVNGDGRKDVVFGGISFDRKLHLYCVVSTGTSFVPLGGGSTPTEIYVDDSDLFALSLNGTLSDQMGFSASVDPTEGGFTSRIAVADFTGDGRDDLVIHRMDGKLKMLTNAGNGTFAATTHDIGGAGVYVHLTSDGGWPGGFNGYYLNPLDVSPMPCDLNGDGLTDYVWSERWVDRASSPNFRVAETKSYMAVTSLPGGGFSPASSIWAFQWSMDTSPFLTNGGWSYRSSSGSLMPCELNGDGMTDFLIFAPEYNGPVPGYPDFDQFYLRPFFMISKGSSGRPEFQTINPLADGPVNVAGNQVYPWFDKMPLSHFLSEFLAPQIRDAFDAKKEVCAVLGASAGDGQTTCDVNLDGRDDYVWYVVSGSAPGWWVMYTVDGGFSAPAPAPMGWLPPQQINQPGTQYNGVTRSSRTALDMNGDGIKDYAYADHYVKDSPGYAGFHISSAPRGDQLIAATDALGRRTEIAYKPITDDSVYTPGIVDNPATAGTVEGVKYPIREVRNATYVVSDVYKDSGASTPAHFSYQYSGNRIDLSGRGPLGFHSFITLDRQTNLFKYQFLAQSFPMTGLTHREQTYRYWATGTAPAQTVNFRAISSHDNTVVFDEVVSSAGAAYGTVYPFMSKAIESRWEDDTTPHYDYTATERTAARSTNAAPELLFSDYTTSPPPSPHITITAKSWFDDQPQGSEPQTTLPTPFLPSDTNASGQNLVVGVDYFPSILTAANMPRKIKHGNLTQLKTDFGGGFTETVNTTYLGVTSNGIAGRVDKIVTSVTSPGYGTEYAPDKRFNYWTNGSTPTSLVQNERVDANRDGDAADAAISTGDDLDVRTYYTRDNLGRVTSTMIHGRTVSGTEFSNVGSLIGGAEYHVGSFIASRTTTTGSFDPKWDLPTSMDNADPYFHTTTTQYDPALGLPTLVTDAENNAPVATSYDALGRKVDVVDQLKGLAVRTRFAWTPTVTNNTDWKSMQTVAPPSGHTGVASGAPITGVVGVTITSTYATRQYETRSADENPYKPEVWTYFDRLGRPIRTIRRGFNGQRTVTDTAYNNIGQVIATSLPYLQGTTPIWTRTTYDALGRVATVNAPNDTVTTNTYVGRATKVTVDAPTQSDVNPAPQTNVTLVDFKGRTVKVWNADNDPGTLNTTNGSAAEASIEYVLDGFGRMRATKLKGQTAQITATYDAHGRQTALNDPDKGNWSYLNNALGHVVLQIDAKGNTTRSTFDRLGRPLKRQTIEPSSGPVETACWYYYDAADNTARNLVAKGSKGWIGAAQREETQTTGEPGYDSLNLKPTTIHYYNSVGLPSIDLSSVDAKWFYTYIDYDTVWRPSSTRHYWRPSPLENGSAQPYVWMDWGYNYGYDSDSYLITLTDTAGRTWWDQPTYDHMDRVTSVRKGAGHFTQRTYDPEDGTITAISTGPSIGSTTIQGLIFGWDALGNLVNRTTAGAGISDTLSETFAYDNLNRLTTRNGSTIAGYAPNGNLTSKVDASGNSSGTYGYSATVSLPGGGTRSLPHAVSTAWGYTMTYDANGNMTGRTKAGETWVTKWAGFDKPRWIARDTTGNDFTDGTFGSEFLYNANRQRVMHLEFDAMSGGMPSHYVRKRLYALSSTVEVDYDNTASTGAPVWQQKKVRIYVSGPEGILGTMEFAPNAPFANAEKALVYHHDHLGSIESVTPWGSSAATLAIDEGGKPSRYSYDPWGERRNPLDWTGKPAATADGGFDDNTPRGYTGHEMLDDLGLVHMNGRIYDPLLGRMLSADILVQAPNNLQSYNRYSYCFNNPLSFTDPTGFKTISDYEKENEKLHKQKAAGWQKAKEGGLVSSLKWMFSKENRELGAQIARNDAAIADIQDHASAISSLTGAQIDARKLDDAAPIYELQKGGLRFYTYVPFASVGGKLVTGQVKGAAKDAAVQGAAYWLVRKVTGPASGEVANGEKAAAEVAEEAVKQTSNDGASGAAANRATFEAYKDTLRAQMSRPAASNPELNALLDKIYRPNAQVGSGSTAAAVRQELATGQPVGGAFHSQKAQEMTTALQRWLNNNPGASAMDRAAAENVIKDMQNALGGNP